MILFLSINYIAFSQSAYNIYDSDCSRWKPKDFNNNNVKNIRVYSYHVTKKGRITRKKLLFSSQEFKSDSSEVFGKDFNLWVQGGGSPYPKWYFFRTYYNNAGLVTKEIKSSASPDNFGDNLYEFHIDIESYKYDSANNQIYDRNVYAGLTSNYEHKIDTNGLTFCDGKIYQTMYNSKNQKISRYCVDDTMYFIPTKLFSVDSVISNCIKCSLPRLNDDYRYDSNGNIKIWTWYTSDNKIHSKKYCFYDDSNRLIKEVDSTGWYFETIQPYLESTTIHKYSDSGSTEIVTFNNMPVHDGDIEAKIIQYSVNGRVKSICFQTDSTETCTNFFYYYNGDKLNKEVCIESNKDKIEIYFSYNNKGLLTSKKTLSNGKTTRFIKYVYE
jgi:hypothetical protein